MYHTANFFYEWEKLGTKKEKRRIYVPGQKLIAFAGIIIENGFSIITRPAVNDILLIHNRMPVIVNNDDEKMWIREELRREEIANILKRSISDVKIA